MNQALALIARNTALAILDSSHDARVISPCPVQLARAERVRQLLAESHKARLRGCPVQAADAYRKACALQRGDDGFRLTNHVV